jgi:hypothetical protein
MCGVLAIVCAGQSGASPTLYRCTVEGVTTYADRPCAADAVRYVPDPSRTSTYSPPPASPATTAGSPPTTPRRPRPDAGEDQGRHAAVCERLRTALKDVAARMRAGYNIKQGEQLRERKRKLEQQRRAHKCR